MQLLGCCGWLIRRYYLVVILSGCQRVAIQLVLCVSGCFEFAGFTESNCLLYENFNVFG